MELFYEDFGVTITFDDDGNWYDAAGKKHVLFTDAEKRQERKEGQRRANLRSMHAQDTIAIPGALANLSPDDRCLAMRLTFLEPIVEPMRIGSNFPRDSWNHELHLIDLLDGSRSPIIYNAERWLFHRTERRWPLLATAACASGNCR